MAILCGTDFSRASGAAVRAAAALARRARTPLILLHALEGLAEFRSDWQHERDRDSVIEYLQQRLAAEAGRLRESGIEALVASATRTEVDLIVVGSHGRTAPSRWLLGSVAEGVAQTSARPVLIVRHPEALEDWSAGKPLRVLVGLDASASAAGALQWLEDFSALGPLELTAGHIAWPPGEHARLDSEGPLNLVTCAPDVQAVLERELDEKLAPLRTRTAVHLRIQAGFGRRADHLLQMAAAQRADLVVVGTHQRSGFDRLWYGSVSRRVVQLFPSNVIVVPARPTTEEKIPEVQRVLVPIDFSLDGNRAVAYAFSVLPRGGVVHLVHVVPAEPGADGAGGDENEDELQAALRALVPSGAGRECWRTEVHVLHGRRTGQAICAAAERIGVDLICMGSKGRSSLFGRNAGVVAQEVLRLSDRPVLIIRPPREPA